MYMYIYIYIHIYICTYVLVRVCMCVCVFVLCVCVYVCIFMFSARKFLYATALRSSSCAAKDLKPENLLLTCPDRDLMQVPGFRWLEGLGL